MLFDPHFLGRLLIYKYKENRHLCNCHFYMLYFRCMKGMFRVNHTIASVRPGIIREEMRIYKMISAKFPRAQLLIFSKWPLVWHYNFVPYHLIP